MQIDDATTETTTAVALPSGAVEQTISAAPVRIKRNNQWVPIDLDLVRNPDGTVEPTAAPSDLRLSGPQSSDTTHELAAVGTGDNRVSVGFAGKLPEPVLDGSMATYPEVQPGVDLQVQATRTGVETFYVVKNRAAAVQLDKLQVPVTGSKVASHRTDTDGNTTLLNSAGKVLATVPAPEMWDSRVDARTGEPTAVRRVPATVSKRKARVAKPKKARDGVGAQFTLDIDAKFLAAADTVYPVIVDPQINPLYTTFDTYVKQGDTVDRGGANDLQLGLVSGDVARSFVHWDSSKLVGKQITAATVNFYNFWSQTCTANSWEIWSTNAASSDTRWSNQPAWNHKEATSTATKGSTGCADGWVSVSGTSFFQRAATAKQSRAYMGIRATSETTANAFKQFRSRNADSSAQVPYASVTYNSYPVVGTRSTTPSTSCVTGAGRPYVNSATPALKAVITDGEGSAIKGVFEWYNSAGTKISGATTASAASSSTVSTTVPSGAFVNGSTYKWRVAGNDGTVGGAWSSFCEFTIDTTAPGAAPTASSATYPAGSSGGAVGAAGTFTFGSNGVTDVAAFLYGLDTNPPTTVVNASAIGGGASVSITPTTGGAHTLFVRSRDRAGNLSAVTSYAFTVDSIVGSVSSPQTGDLSAGKVVLSGTGGPTSTGATYQWRRAETDAWQDIPAADVTRQAGGAAVTWPLATTGSGQFPSLNWNVESTVNAAEAGPEALDGPLQVRTSFAGGTAGTSAPARFTLDRTNASAPTAEVGAGVVNLLTGNVSVDASDAEDAGEVGVHRSFNTRRPGGTDPLFGPGWVSLVETGTAGAYNNLTVTGSLAQLGTEDGETIGFTKSGSTSAGATFAPEVGEEALTLDYTSASDSFKLTDSRGNTVTFERASGDPAGVYTPYSAVAVGTGDTTAVSWERKTVDGIGVVRPTRIIAPAPDGVNCSTSPTTTVGCKTLTFTYATTTAGSDYAGRIKELTYTAYDPATSAMKTEVQARYGYTSTGRLAQAWDPRFDYTDATGTHHLATTYGYDADGILTTVTPAGEQLWQLAYTTVPGDSGKGRLAAVSRSALAAGTATTTVVYRVPLGGAGAPDDLSPATTARWGQTVHPVDATAVFPATQVPDGNQAGGVLPSSWRQATVTYMDGNARRVNSLTPGKNITSYWHDQYGNTTRTLTPGNRSAALSSSSTDSPATEATLAAALSTQYRYSPDGQRQLEKWGPEHSVTISDWSEVRGREHTVYRYDEGAEDPSQAYDLVTTEIRSIQHWNSAGAAVDSDRRTTKTEYDWKLRVETATVDDAGGLAVTSRTDYDATTGDVIAQSRPAGDGENASTSTIAYYRAGTGSGDAACDNHPEWAGLSCATAPAGQPKSDPELLTTYTTYNMYGEPLVVTEKNSGGTVRTTTMTYDQAGRANSTTVRTAESLGGSLGVRRDVYDPATGMNIRTEQLDASGAVTARIVRAYDSLGRQVGYTDATGTTSTTSYDIASRPQSVFDGKANQVYGYDDAGVGTGQLTQITDSQAGTFTATYNADGRLADETLPNGMSVHHYYNEEGVPTGLQYMRGDQFLYEQWVGVKAQSRWAWDWSTLNDASYEYDGVGRLIEATQTVGTGGCVVRRYGFDQNSNRTSQTTNNPTGSSGCNWNDTTSSRSWDYDSADRIINSGYTYDDLGRTLTVPGADTAGGASATTTYFANDLVKSITQGGSSTTNQLDVVASRYTSSSNTDAAGTVDVTNHYSDDSDNPAWYQTGAGYTRMIARIGGVAAQYSSDGNSLQWQIASLHGDIVAVVANGSTGVAATYAYDEYGNTLAAPTPKYGYLGEHQRSADNTGGFITMGVRYFNPVTGRFLQTDPVYGGGANAYAYPTDPINMMDIDGMMWKWVLERGINNLAFLASFACTAGKILCGILLGAAVGAVKSVAIQVFVDGKKLNRLDWGKVSGEAIDGAIQGAGGGLSKAGIKQAAKKGWPYLKKILNKIKNNLARYGFKRIAALFTTILTVVANTLAIPASARR